MRRSRTPGGRAAAFAFLLLSWSTAHAGADCSVSVSGVAFGVYDPLLAAPDDSTGSVTVTCAYVAPGGATNVNYTVALSTGTSGAYAQRRMSAGASRLTYNLFVDAARSVIWGNATAGTAVVSGAMRVGPGVGNGTRSATHTVYGRAPALQATDSGSYADSIVVTLTF